MQAIFLDTETTGLDPFIHRLLEIAFKVVDISTGYEKLTYQAIVKQSLEVWDQRDPISGSRRWLHQPGRLGYAPQRLPTEHHQSA